jgi:hypothetical protein
MSNETGIPVNHQQLSAALGVISDFERPGHDVSVSTKHLVASLGGSWDQVQDCESPYAIMAYLMALAVRSANQTK